MGFSLVGSVTNDNGATVGRAALQYQALNTPMN